MTFQLPMFTPALSPAPFVYLVVLNWNGFEDTHECLNSLRDLAYPRYNVLVVDNASTDDSLEQIIAHHPEVEYVVCTQNLGIAAGYNRGIQVALERSADYIVVMNNDLTFDPTFLAYMVTVSASWKNCEIVMPKIFYYDEPGTIWSTGAYSRLMPSNIVMRGRNQPDRPEFQQTMPIEFAPSCCLLLTRALCEQIAFDECYFFYYDDWDFCVQARMVGAQLIFAADAHIWHKVSRSTMNSPKSLRWWKVLGQSCVRYHRKHHSLQLLATYVAWVILREAVKGNTKSIPTFLRGIQVGLRTYTTKNTHPQWSS